MKTLILNSFIVGAIIIFRPYICKCQTVSNPYQDKPITDQQTSTITNSKSDRFFWSEINAGYANHGPCGSANFNFRKGKFIISSQYNKSHTCYKNDKNEKYFINDPNIEKHVTVESVSMLAGVILRGKFNPGFSLGVSWSNFKYVSAVDIENNVTLSRIWETTINRDYTKEKLSQKIINTIGVPMEIKFHFAPKHFIGFDAGIKGDLNTHSSTFSAELGIRIGRIKSKHAIPGS